MAMKYLEAILTAGSGLWSIGMVSSLNERKASEVYERMLGVDPE
jgi:hypothetical protein